MKKRNTEEIRIENRIEKEQKIPEVLWKTIFYTF